MGSLGGLGWVGAGRAGGWEVKHSLDRHWRRMRRGDSKSQHHKDRGDCIANHAPCARLRTRVVAWVLTDMGRLSS